MAKREVTVVINGEEFVSKAAGEADTALGGFTSKVPGYAKVIAGLTIAYQAVQAVVGKVRDVVIDSFAAYDELATSQRKLEGTSKLTGLSLEYLSDIASKGRKEFGLSRIEANEYATEVAKLAVKSGDASKATDLLSGFLNIGAARGLSAAESLKAAQQAILGIDEGTDKLFGKNPSVLYDDYAKAVGGTASKFTDTEKAAALAYAVMDGGNKVIGSYSDFLNSAQGKQALLNSQLQEMKGRLGEAMQPMRAFLVDAMGQLLQSSGQGVSAIGALTQSLVAFLGALAPIVQPVLTVGTVLLQVFSVGAEQIIISIRRLSAATAITVGSMISSFGELAERGGRFLKLLGIDVVADTGKRMREFGEEMVEVNQNKLLRVEFDALGFKDRQKALWAGWKGETVKAAQDTGKGIEQAVTSATPKVAASAGAMGTAINDRLGKPLKVALEMTQGALDRLGKAAQDQLPTKPAQDFGAAMDTIRKNADELVKKFPPITQGTEDAAANTKDMAREVEGFARGALDAAGAFGVIDESAQRSLNSAINIASSLKNIATSGFSFAGVTGVIGGVASIVSTMMQGDAERKRLQRQNNDALAKLSKDIGGLKFNITGEDFAKAQTALGGVIGNLRGGRGAANENDVRNALYGQGLTMEDFDRIAKEFGIEVRTKSGALNVDSVKAVFDALGTVSLGRVGQDFGSQLEFFRNSQRINGNEGPAATQALVDFLRTTGGVRALDGIDVANDPNGALNALRSVFTQMGNGEGLSAGQLGRLTGSQLSDILMELIGGLTSGSGSGGGTVTIPDVGTGGGSISMPADTIQAVIGAMNTNLGTILTTHTTLHERIAKATEGTYETLQYHTTLLERIADGSRANNIDEALEAERFALAVQQGRGASY